MKLGWTQEKALTTPVGTKGPGVPVKDHLGNTYSSTSAMCVHYGIRDGTFRARKELGWDQEKALTMPAAKVREEVRDHLGNTYPSIVDMCRHYGITYGAFHARMMSSGWELGEALTTPVKGRRDAPQ